MRYAAITVITFLVLIGVNMVASRINLANSALDIEIRLGIEED